jgi:hypothetical protein
MIHRQGKRDESRRHGLFLVLSGLGPLLVRELTYAYGYKISEPRQFLCSAYIFWSLYWGFKEWYIFPRRRRTRLRR